MEVPDFSKTLKYMNYIHKFIRVKGEESNCEGWMKALDPITGNILLVTLDENKSKVIDSILIICETISACEVLESDEEVVNLMKNVSLSGSIPEQEISERKERVISWIKRSRIPIKENEDGSLEICDFLTLMPPYFPEDCICDNSRMLSRISEIIRRMPENFEEKE